MNQFRARRRLAGHCTQPVSTTIGTMQPETKGQCNPLLQAGGPPSYSNPEEKASMLSAPRPHSVSWTRQTIALTKKNCELILVLATVSCLCVCRRSCSCAGTFVGAPLPQHSFSLYQPHAPTLRANVAKPRCVRLPKCFEEATFCHHARAPQVRCATFAQWCK